MSSETQVNNNVQTILTTVNNVVFSYDLWCLDILGDNFRRIKEDDFNRLLSSIVKKLEFFLAIPYTVKVNEFKKLVLVPKESSIFIPSDINKNFIYLKPSIMFGEELKFLLEEYENMCYATIPSFINKNIENYLDNENNYFLIFKNNLVDDERILRNFLGHNIKVFECTKEGLFKYLDRYLSNDKIPNAHFISDNFWVELSIFNIIEKENLQNDNRIDKFIMSGKSILYTPDNKGMFDALEKALNEEGNKDIDISGFGVSKLWDLK